MTFSPEKRDYDRFFSNGHNDLCWIVILIPASTKDPATILPWGGRGCTHKKLT